MRVTWVPKIFQLQFKLSLGSISGKANATVEALISILNELSILGMTAGMSWQFLLMSLSSKSLIRVFTHIQKDSGKELFWLESKRCAHCNTKLTLTCQCHNLPALGMLLDMLPYCTRIADKNSLSLYQKGFRIILFRDILWCRLVNCQCLGQISYWGQKVFSCGSHWVNICLRRG